MITCFCRDCIHNDGDGMCDDYDFTPTIEYQNGCCAPPICTDYEEHAFEEGENKK